MVLKQIMEFDLRSVHKLCVGNEGSCFETRALGAEEEAWPPACLCVRNTIKNNPK